MNAKGPQVKVNKQTRPFSIFDRVSLRQIMGKPGIMCKQGGVFKIHFNDWVFHNICCISARFFIYHYYIIQYRTNRGFVGWYFLHSLTGNRFYTCEGGSLYIYCPAGSYLVVFSANYGRLSSDVCPGPGSNNINCESPGSVDVVRNYCEGLTNCQLEASNAMFGDPCPGTHKYLEVNIGCRFWKEKVLLKLFVIYFIVLNCDI